MIYVFVLIVLFILDQITKNITHNNLAFGESIPVIQDFFHFTYVRNQGVAFGIFQGKLQIITIISIFAVAGIIYYVLKYEKNSSKLIHYAYTLIISGALGNISDRIFRGYVIDMIDFRGIWSYIFNMADVYINIGVALMLLDYVLVEKRKKDLGGKNK